MKASIIGAGDVGFNLAARLSGRDCLQPGDRAIVFTLAVHARKVSRFFL